MSYPNSLHALALSLSLFLPISASGLEINSPNGQLMVRIDTPSSKAGDASLTWQLFAGQSPINQPSELGLVMEDRDSTLNFTIINSTPEVHDETWAPVHGERSTIRNHYNEVTVDLASGKSKTTDLQIVCRAYDTGVAFRYVVPGSGEEFTIQKELTDFKFQSPFTCWSTTAAQGVYKESTIAEAAKPSDRPFVIRMSPTRYIAIQEAALIDSARMRLTPAKQGHTLDVVLDGSISGKLPFTSPWRVVSVADSAGGLLENNDILLNLNEPSRITDTSWIKPGKILRDVTLTTVGAKLCVDYANKSGIQYLLFDAGWYGNEHDVASDATTVTVDPARSSGPLDLPEIIRYAKSKDIGVILYVNRRAMAKQLDEILPLYEKWGVKGVKYGFVSVGSQVHTSFLHEAVAKAAKHHLMVNIHDEYRPTGVSRTWPNLMTAEGISGDEATPSSTQELTLLFTRMLAGPADHTVCYFVPRVTENWSHGFQLAKSVCFFSPWQHIFWYDRPIGAPINQPGAGNSAPTFIEDLPELEFFKQLPTTWDDTRVIDGSIGEHAIIARRSGEDWFVGCMNAKEAKTLKLPLSFLKPGISYNATTYSDDPSSDSPTKIKISTSVVTSESTVNVSLQPNGGAALRLTPVKP